MKDENWKNKRIKEIDNICKGNKDCHENFIDEAKDIYESKADSYDEFVTEQEEKKAKYMPQLIEEWRGKSKNFPDYLITYGSAVIGALTFAFTDSSPQVEPGGPVDPSDQVATSAHTFWNVTCTGGFLPKTQRMVIGNNLTTAGNIGYNGGNYWMEVHGTWKHTAGTTNNADTCQSTRGYVRNFVLDGTGELDLKTNSMTFGSLRNISSGPVTGVANQ